MRKNCSFLLKLCLHRRLAIPSAFLILASSPAFSANLSWTSTGDSTLGGTGTWDTTSALWWNGSSAQTWSTNTTIGNTAVFAGTAGTVTLGTNVNALGLTFSTTGYTVTGNTLGIGTGGINASSLTSGTTTISSNLSLGSGLQSWTVGNGGSLAINGTVTRSTGSTVYFSSTGITSTTLTNTNGILGGWATTGSGADWAANDGSGNIGTYTGYTLVTGNQTGAGASAQNWKTTANTVLTADATINSLNAQNDFTVKIRNAEGIAKRL